MTEWLNNNKASLNLLVLQGSTLDSKKLYPTRLSVTRMCVRCEYLEEFVRYAFFHWSACCVIWLKTDGQHFRLKFLSSSSGVAFAPVWYLRWKRISSKCACVCSAWCESLFGRRDRRSFMKVRWSSLVNVSFSLCFSLVRITATRVRLFLSKNFLLVLI